MGVVTFSEQRLDVYEELPPQPPPAPSLPAPPLLPPPSPSDALPKLDKLFGAGPPPVPAPPWQQSPRMDRKRALEQQALPACLTLAAFKVYYPRTESPRRLAPLPPRWKMGQHMPARRRLSAVAHPIVCHMIADAGAEFQAAYVTPEFQAPPRSRSGSTLSDRRPRTQTLPLPASATPAPAALEPTAQEAQEDPPAPQSEPAQAGEELDERPPELEMPSADSAVGDGRDISPGLSQAADARGLSPRVSPVRRPVRQPRGVAARQTIPFLPAKLRAELEKLRTDVAAAKAFEERIEYVLAELAPRPAPAIDVDANYDRIATAPTATSLRRTPRHPRPPREAATPRHTKGRIDAALGQSDRPPPVSTETEVAVLAMAPMPAPTLASPRPTLHVAYASSAASGSPFASPRGSPRPNRPGSQPPGDVVAYMKEVKMAEEMVEKAAREKVRLARGAPPSPRLLAPVEVKPLRMLSARPTLEELSTHRERRRHMAGSLAVMRG